MKATKIESCCKADLCKEPIFGEGYCIEHLRQYYRSRWDLKNGWEGIMRFAFECYPELVREKYGMADFHPDVYKALYHGFTSKEKMDNLFAFFCHRDSAKTTIGPIIGTLYALGFGLKSYIVYRADSLGKAQKNYLRNIRRGIESERFKFVFGNMVPTKRETNLKDTETILIVRNKVFTTLVAMGLDQSSRSLLNYGIRPDMFFWDDIEHKDNTASEGSVNKLIDKVFAEDIGAIDQEGMGIMTQTPIVMNGLYQAVEENPVFKVVKGPIYKMKDGEFVLDRIGQRISNWEKRFPISKIKKLEESLVNRPQLGRRFFWREYLLILLPDDEFPFDPSWIKYCSWDYKNEHGKNWLKLTSINGYLLEDPKWEPVYIVFGVDPATSEDGRSCDSACAITGFLSGGRCVNMDYFVGKYRTRDVLKNFSGYGPYDICLDYDNIEKRGIIGEIFRYSVNKYVPDLVAIETIGEYENTYRELKYSHEYWYEKKFRKTIRFEGYKPHGGEGKKRDRIRNQLSSPYESNLVYHTGVMKVIRDDNGKFVREDIPMKELYDQLVNVSISEKLDLVDALHIAFRYREFPDPISETSYVEKTWRDNTEEYTDDFILNAHEAMI